MWCRKGKGRGQQQNYVGLLRAGDGYKKRAFRRENEGSDREKPVWIGEGVARETVAENNAAKNLQE